jgi:hypothetical protein
MKKFVWILAVVVALVIAATPAAAQGKVWKVPANFATIKAALESPKVKDGDTLMVGPGQFAGAYVNKQVTIKGVGRAEINSGPLHSSGMDMGFRLLAGSSGASIENLTFTVDLAIMNGGAVSNVTVTQNRFLNAVQAVSNWRGNGWDISHNEIIDLRSNNGGGIGILIGDYMGGVVQDNLVANNTIAGTLHVSPVDGGGYAGSGIVIYADFRYGGAGANSLSYNRVIKNKVSLVSDTPAVVDINAFELTDSRDDALLDPVIHNNAIGFNDFRGTEQQILLTPASLDLVNDISRNFGENRGHGLSPKLFGPVR